MRLRHSVLALFAALALTNQASAQFGFGFPGFGWGGFPWGGYGGFGGSGGYFPGYGYPYRFGFGPFMSGLGGYGPGLGIPTTYTAPITVFTSSGPTRPVLPPNSPLSLDPNVISWADEHGYYLRGGQRQPRYRPVMYPATPVTANDLGMPRQLAANIQVVVPSTAASISIDGRRMTQQGLVRNFVTPPLEAGKQYALSIRMDDGGRVQTRTAFVRAGEEPHKIDFTQDR